MCTPQAQAMMGQKPAASTTPAAAANPPTPSAEIDTPMLLGKGMVAKGGKSLMTIRQVRDQQIKDSGG